MRKDVIITLQGGGLERSNSNLSIILRNGGAILESKLTIDDLRVGMHVAPEQLSDLYGGWVFINPETADEEGFDILYFCDENTKDDKEIEKIQKQYGKTTVIFQPKFYEDEDAAIYD